MTTQDTFISHLVELRDRLLRALLAIAIAFILLLIWPGAASLYDFLATPLMQSLPEGTKMIATGVVAPFFVPFKVTAIVALVVALPYVLWQGWAFVAPGLYQHEKRIAVPLVVASTLLFLTGIAFCYYFVFGRVFAFINNFAPKSITPAPDIENYFNFVLTMFVAFGVTFEIPVIVLVMVKAGLVSVAKLREIRPYVIVGNFVVAAVLTPPDIASQFMLAIPMCLLYEAGILLAGVMQKAKNESAETTPPPASEAGQK
jgi:sec-independent protein translocase protein TatC